MGDCYASFLDEAAIEAKGIAPLKPALDRLARIKDKKALAKEIGARTGNEPGRDAARLALLGAKGADAKTS